MTSSRDGAHPPKPAVIVHLNTEVPPIVSPVTAEVSLFTEVTTAVPEITVYVPVSVPAGVFAASVAVVILQRFWSGPAADIVVVGSTFIVTSSVEAGHPPKPEVIVHLKTEVPPIVSPITPEVSLLIEVTTAVPDNTVHVPVSDPAGELAARVAVVILQRFWSGPAADTVVLEIGMQAACEFIVPA